jgi:hypothetical protein
MFAVFCARGLAAPNRAVSCSENVPWRGVLVWLSFLRGGELPSFAWLSRSSVARSLASRASSSCVCVVTACFLFPVSRALAHREDGDILLKDSLVQHIKTSVQLEQTVELRHEGLGYCPADRGQNVRELCLSAGKCSRLRPSGWLPAVVWVFHGCGLCRVGGGHDGSMRRGEVRYRRGQYKQYAVRSKVFRGMNGVFKGCCKTRQDNTQVA